MDINFYVDNHTQCTDGCNNIDIFYNRVYIDSIDYKRTLNNTITQDELLIIKSTIKHYLEYASYYYFLNLKRFLKSSNYFKQKSQYKYINVSINDIINNKSQLVNKSSTSSLNTFYTNTNTNIDINIYNIDIKSDKCLYFSKSPDAREIHNKYKIQNEYKNSLEPTETIFTIMRPIPKLVGLIQFIGIPQEFIDFLQTENNNLEYETVENVQNV